MVGWHEHNDDPALLRESEAQLGTRFALVRMYQQWQRPNRRVTEMINDGRLVLVSHKPPAAGGWGAVASGAEDAMIRSLASTYKAFGAEVLFSFHHEPHDDASDVKGGSSGTAAEFKAAWRRIRTIFDGEGASHSAGGNVFFAYSSTEWWALKAVPGGPPGSGDPLYPGDDIVDVFAHDHYNWASCRDAAWKEFSTGWAPLVQLAAAHRKPLIAAEFGSPPAGGLRNDWFRKAGEWLRTDPLARQWMWGFAYFHTLHDTCPWDFLNQGDDGRLGWQDAFRNSYFTGTPFSLATRTDQTAQPVSVAPTPTGTIATGPAPSTTVTTKRPTAPAKTPGVPPTTGSEQSTTGPAGPSKTNPAGPSTTNLAGPSSATTEETGSSTTSAPSAAAAHETAAGSVEPSTTAGRPTSPLLAVGLLALLAALALTRRVIGG